MLGPQKIETHLSSSKATNRPSLNNPTKGTEAQDVWPLCGLGCVGHGVHAQLITSGRRYAIDIRRVALHHNTSTQVTLRAMTTPS